MACVVAIPVAVPATGSGVAADLVDVTPDKVRAIAVPARVATTSVGTVGAAVGAVNVTAGATAAPAGIIAIPTADLAAAARVATVPAALAVGSK